MIKVVIDQKDVCYLSYKCSTQKNFYVLCQCTLPCECNIYPVGRDNLLITSFNSVASEKYVEIVLSCRDENYGDKYSLDMAQVYFRTLFCVTLAENLQCLVLMKYVHLKRIKKRHLFRGCKQTKIPFF